MSDLKPPSPGGPLSLSAPASSEKTRRPASVRPSSVYRLQFNSQFTFQQAEKILPYLHDLGIDCVYASPYFKAVPGSPHGYNIMDPRTINPEIGGEEAHARFCEALKKQGLKQILDIVPNHMGIRGNQNPWWQDVLENGPASVYAHFFDIDWNPIKTEVRDKVLLPILGDYYGNVLSNQEIRLVYSGGEFGIDYFEHHFPVAPETYARILETGLEELRRQFLNEEDPALMEYLSIVTALKQLPPQSERKPEAKAVRNREKEIAKKRLSSLSEAFPLIRQFIESRVEIFNGRRGTWHSFDALDALLNSQAYRLAYWRVASEEINYRRFFDINELAAIRTEDPSVFQAVHERIFQLIGEGKVQGVRIDHPDGLYDPPEYFRRLQAGYLTALAEARGRSDEITEAQASEAPLWTVAEKILERRETLPSDWPVHGTVGYEFLNGLNGLFVQAKNERLLDEIYESFTGVNIDFDQLIYEKKKFFSLIYMASEINALGHKLDIISEGHRSYRDFTRNNLTLAIREVIACFPVYRTYISPRSKEVSERDQYYIKNAVEKAKRRTPSLNPAVYDFLKRVLLLQTDTLLEDREQYLDFVLRFQQLSGPLMAKGLEDTAFYIYHRLVSLNEVGSDPKHFGVSIEDFHVQNQERAKLWPYSFLSTSTHDTKRSEDVRFRVDVLSEIPAEWKDRLQQWSRMNANHKTIIEGLPQPSANIEYMIYQTLLGVWPWEEASGSQKPDLRDRLIEYFLKCVREAKIHTNWVQPNEEYEAAVCRFVEALLNPETPGEFRHDFEAFQKKITGFGLWNSLSAMVLKMGSPGVVDVYQGCEFWNYTLVDPDNRRPVDYEERVKALDEMKKESGAPDYLGRLMRSPHDGRLKLYVLWKSLNLRKKWPDVFTEGEYLPLSVTGPRSQNALAFLRRSGARWVVTAAGRFFSELNMGNGAAADWADTKILLPQECAECELTDIFSGKKIKAQLSGEGPFLLLSDLFSAMNAAMLTPAAPPH